MDFNNNDNGAGDPWDWQRDGYCFEKTSDFDISDELWYDIPQNEDDLSYIFDDETTPVKACGDLAYSVDYNSVPDHSQKEVEECRETSQVKRRRMLQFNTRDRDHSLSNEEMSSAYLKVNGKEGSIKDVIPAPQWMPGASEYALGNASASGYEDLQSAEGWLAECFNDAEMQFSPEELNFPGANDVQLDIAELIDIAPSHEQNIVPKPVPRTPLVFKGRKSFIRTPTKLASSVAYPFAFIKPSGAHGDVTLKEINQRIRIPPPSKPKQPIEDPYPKSALSGKPVIGKTKIRTEGGKGSITITRTKG